MAVVATEIESRLRKAFSPTRFELSDDSDRHRGHAGHDSRGESHFSLLIESDRFEGLSRVARQRAVHAELADLLSDRVHAFQVRCVAPGDRRG